MLRPDFPLYPYQREAYEKFIERGDLLVAYEMGLGKTPIAIACAEELMGEEIETCLIVCPANLRWQWAQAIAKFTDVDTVEKKVKDQTITVPWSRWCTVIDGTPKVRKELYDGIRLAGKWGPDYIIMSYETVVNDWNFVRKIKPGMVVLDEATAIKSFKAKRTKKIKQLTAPFRVALTGTPIENRPEELYSIMQWVDKDVLGRYDLFDKAYVVRNRFGGVLRYKNLGVLHQRLGIAMSRRTRLDPAVAPYLPEVDAGIWEVPLDPGSRGIHNRIAKDLLGELAVLAGSFEEFSIDAHYSGGINESTKAGKVMAMQQALEMFLDHPELVVRSARDFNDPDSKRGSKYAAQLVESGALDHLPPARKLEMLVSELNIILGFHKNKIIIFTKYVYMLTLIEEALDVQCVQYHGQMDASAKSAAVAKFTSDPETRVFLSSHAGAYGTDLYMANYLINYDLPWSSGKADQINGRHVRASSEFTNVFVRDMVTTGTVEQRKHNMLTFKRNIAGAVLDATGQDEYGRVENDVETLTSYLQESLDG